MQLPTINVNNKNLGLPKTFLDIKVIVISIAKGHEGKYRHWHYISGS